MKICYISFNLQGQGTYWRAFHFGRILAGLGHEVTILCTSPTSRLGVVERMDSGVRVVQTPDLFHGPLRSGWDPWNVLNRIGWLRNRRFDIVHAYEARPTVIYPALSLRQRNVPLFMDWCDWFGKGGSVEMRHNSLVRAVLRPVETYFEEHYRALSVGTTVICSTLRDKVMGLGIPIENILLARNGVRLDLFRTVENSPVRARLGLEPGDYVIGYLGSAFPEDARLMWRALEQVSGRLPGARLLLLNYRTPGKDPFETSSDSVRCVNERNETRMAELLSACDLFWLPLSDCGANWGRFPIKLGIYLAMAKPVVCTSVGDVAGIIEQWSAGRVCAPNPVAFAA